MLDRWYLYPERYRDDPDFADTSRFRRLTRDLYIPANEIGFWQGVIRDRDEPGWDEAATAIKGRQPLTVDLLYGDYDGGQHTVSRFAILPAVTTPGWAQVGRHWNLDRDDPR